MKKFICAAAALAMSAQCFSGIAWAAGDTLSINVPSTILAGITLTLDIGSEASDFSYQWLSSDSEEGEYEALLSDTESKYVITPRDKNKYIKAQITNLSTGEVTQSDNFVYVETLGPVSRTSFSSSAIEATMTTPAENIFSVDGQKFILLEEMNDSESHYYVMTENMYGGRAFDSNGYARFDPEADGNIGKFLNNEFLTDGGGGTVLPDGIKEHINYDHVWNTEAGLADGDCGSDYSFTAGISFLSMSEAVKYHGKYGWQPRGSGVTTPWWSRTQRGASGSDDNILVMMNAPDSGKGNMWDKICTDSYFIRPVFYLDEDFFKEVKCDLSSTGEVIKSLITEKYTLDELREIYTAEELALLGFEIKSAVITANESPVKALSELKLQMTDSDAVDFEYCWYISDSEEEKGAKVISDFSDTYMVAANDMGKWIGGEVTPIYEGGVRGETVETENKIHVAQLGSSARTDYPAEERQQYKNNPPEYLFVADGEEMILLDAFDREKSTIYAMTADAKGTYTFDSDNTQKFDTQDSNNIGSWLNNGFLNAAVSISDEVQQYIDKEHLWWTEAGNSSGICPEDYSQTAGVGLLSRSEYSKYWGKFGWDNNESIKTSWWLRTGRNTGRSDVFCGTGVQDGNFSNLSANGYGNTWNKAANTSYYVRPTFYLNRDFVLNVKVTQAGEKAAEALRNMYTVEELLSCSAGYTEADLIRLGIIERPSVDNVALDGPAAVGAEVFGIYDYIGEKEEGASVCGFEISDSKDGEYQKLSDGKETVIAAAQDGKYIRFFVTPTDIDGTAGETCYSEPVRVTGAAKAAVYELELTDGNGREVTSLSEAERIVADFKLSNYSGTAKKVWAMFFVYDAQGNMIDNIGVMTELSAQDRKIPARLSIELPEYSDGNYVKFIVWDGLDTMAPAQNAAVVIE